MKGYIRHIICGLILVVICKAVNSQVSVKASVDRDKILIGEPIKLVLQAYTPLGEPVTWFNLDTIPGFEFIEKGKLDTIENVDNKKLEQSLVITSFDSGSVVFPPLEIAVGARTYFTDSIVIDVAYHNFDPAAEYRDIKAIAEVDGASADYIPWIIGAATLIAIALIVWLLRKKKKALPASAGNAAALPPYEEAMEKLALLKNYDWTLPGATKSYYTELNDIFRVFVFRKMSITSLEKTNDELIVQLKQAGISKENFSQLAQALRMSDFVKFARYQPERSDNDHNWEVIRSSVKTLNDLEDVNQQPTATDKGVRSNKA
jgi:hypothetical protein